MPVPAMRYEATEPFTKPWVSASLNETPPLDPFRPCATVTHRHEVFWRVWLLGVTLASFIGVNVIDNVVAKASWPAVVSELYTV